MIIETKYDVGSRVFAAVVDVTAVHVTCPDCLGDRTWSAALPNGELVAISCPTCKYGFEGSRGKIVDYEVTGRVATLTIGSVRGASSDEGVDYMCNETGVGSGRVWYERDLYPDEESAKAALPALVTERKLEREEAGAKEYARKRNEAGAMASYYRRQIRDAKKAIEDAEKGLERLKGRNQEDERKVTDAV